MKNPSVLRVLYDNSLALFDAGVRAGMGAGRQKDTAQYNAYARIDRGVYGTTPMSKAFAHGFVIGYNAIASGVMM